MHMVVTVINLTEHNDMHQAAPHPAPATAGHRQYSTEQVARMFNVQPASLRAALCIKGHYFGIRSSKLPNRLLSWPADAVDALARGEAIA